MLKDIIKSKGLKQSYLAQRMGVSVVTMSNWVKEKSSPSKKNLEKLSELLEVPIKDLVH
ncbi:MAG: transcriptional regulator [Flavobacteriaceae bacterium]|jgi:transcriptional regulator with XRE-family HTH domain|nr:transcriptional regulator [Flavobacteriaceae bacterium]|tara:strand:- start:72654 stop:72830 length:177 start_codon:yes stop_codon:yes gene_type:complete